MRKVDKSSSPQEFEEWKELANEEWTPSWENFQNPEKQAVLTSLIEDQGGICCYCECEIDPNQSHIEHILPRSKFSDQKLDYQNLLASCQRETDKGEPLTCGKARGDWYDVELYLNPCDSNSSSKITYLMDGRVKATEEKFEKFISELNLDSRGKRDARLAVISVLIEDEELSDEDVREVLEAWRQPGGYKPHISALEAAAMEFYAIA
ncbi:TIGR02646 family protein [Rhodobacteraceae bacterium R_SAG6]|nr:TIGR02646 family protein [Rhodobacteraceae bacterium R_SAG6]